MSLAESILKSLPEADVLDVIVGLNWTGVTVKYKGQIYCGLSSTLKRQLAHGKEYDVPEAGVLSDKKASELSAYCTSEKPTLASIGTATLNALLQTKPMPFVEKNAEDIIAQHSAGRNIVVVGHFPFTNRIRDIAKNLVVLENNPQPGDLHANQAKNVIPSADVVAITGMAFTNNTLENLLELCQPNSKVIVLGASTPITSILFDYGADYLCGAVTVNHEKVMKTIAQGAVYPQIARAGLNLISVQRSVLNA